MADKKLELNMDELNEVNGGMNLENVKQRTAAKHAIISGASPKAGGLVQKNTSVKVSKIGNVDISSSPEIKELDSLNETKFI